MQIVILASGKGKRMGDLTKIVPKPMLKIKGKPILEHKLEALPKEIDEIVFVIGYKGEFIMNHFKRNFNGRKIIYIFQRNLNGTGGALHLAKNVLHDRFLVMMGDDLYHKKDFKKMMRHELAVLGYDVGDITQFGIIRTNRSGHLVDIAEKPKRSESRLANTGLYALNKSFFDYDLVSIGGGEFGLPQTLSSMAGKHKIKVEKSTLWHPIGSPEDLRKAEEIIHKFV
jgi:UDP-N-acetylglucosamine diphosphorylase / glucose-1-phosphate thymidylyltransferase / UDP-N-acetylgalactosamine diphosphorylase / glucosamine-1-phosphate N-acetyltransferase / galactosamine-1-phosphate N-acetyltransferase